MEMPFFATVGNARRREMLIAVASVLIKQRNHAVQMQEALEQSGLLYDDVVKHFGDLDDVLLSLVRGVSRWISEPMTAKADGPRSYEEMTEGLVEFARRYAHANATILPGIFRVFFTESSRRSQLRQSFYDAGPAQIATSLTSFLERAKAAKIIAFPAGDLAAEALMGVLREPLYYELAIHARHLSPVLASADCAPDVVRLFADGCARSLGR